VGIKIIAVVAESATCLPCDNGEKTIWDSSYAKFPLDGNLGAGQFLPSGSRLANTPWKWSQML